MSGEFRLHGGVVGGRGEGVAVTRGGEHPLEDVAMRRDQQVPMGDGDRRVGQEFLLAVAELLPASTAARGFGREDESIRPTYELLRQGAMPKSKSLFGQLLNDMLGDGKPGTVREQRIDGSTLPDFELVRRYFGTSGFAMETRSQGWYVVGVVLPRGPQQEQEVARRPVVPASR